MFYNLDSQIELEPKKEKIDIKESLEGEITNEILGTNLN